jgi:NTE family protein
MKKELTLLLIFCTLFGFSQEDNDVQKDVKVGLVLSGGGAKGFAHVGVLKVLEEAGVRVDYIGGTSMGAIVGSMYASGYSAKEIDSLIRTFDFDKIMQDEVPRKSKPFYEKENGEKYAITFPLKKGKITIPKAVSKGQNVLNLMTELLQHVDTITDFNKLPIPFFCIATNLETGKQEILNSGFLPKAVQASGAFPTLLEPVEIGGKLLIDGGVVNNFPIDEIIEMGADIVIGVDLRSDYDEKDELDSALKIVNQIISFQMYGNYDDRIKKTDVYIHPDMNKYSVTSFDKLEEIEAIGEKVAREKFVDFLRIAKQQSKKRRPFYRQDQQNELLIKSILIKGNQDYTRNYVKGKMKIEEGQTILFSDLVEGINNLTATGNFTNIQYKIDTEEDGSIFSLKLKQNDISTYVKFAAHYDNLYKTSVLANVTTKHLLSKNDILSVDMVLGDNLRYNLDYFIDNGTNWSFGLRSRLNTFKTNIDYSQDNISLINLEYRDVTNQVYFQTVFNRKFALGVGAEYKHINAFTKTFETINNQGKTFFDKSSYGNLISYLKFDTYDNKYFQKEGVFVDIDLKWYLLSSDYNENFNSFSQLKGKIGYAYTFLKRMTVHFESEVGITIGDNENTVLDYRLGGSGENFINTFIAFDGYDFGSLTADGFFKTSLTLRYEFAENHYLMTTANAARIDDDLFNQGRIFEDTKLGYAAGYGFDSFMGPIEVNYTWSPDTGNNFWYFNLGYWF